MIEVRCPACDKKLFEAEGSYQISAICPRCKQKNILKSAKPTLASVQNDFAEQLAQAGMRANNTR